MYWHSFNTSLEISKNIYNATTWLKFPKHNDYLYLLLEKRIILFLDVTYLKIWIHKIVWVKRGTLLLYTILLKQTVKLSHSSKKILFKKLANF